MSVTQINNHKYLEVIGAVLAIAEAERQFRDVKHLVDRTIGTAQKFWPVVPLLAAGWAFMVADDERFAVLEGVADQVLPLLPMERLERWLTS
jgi:hypothetical protein